MGYAKKQTEYGVELFGKGTGVKPSGFQSEKCAINVLLEDYLTKEKEWNQEEKKKWGEYYRAFKQANNGALNFVVIGTMDDWDLVVVEHRFDDNILFEYEKIKNIITEDREKSITTEIKMKNIFSPGEYGEEIVKKVLVDRYYLEEFEETKKEITVKLKKRIAEIIETARGETNA